MTVTTNISIYSELKCMTFFEPRAKTGSDFQTKSNVTSPRRQVTEVKPKVFPFVLELQKREKKSILSEQETNC